jgi:hypothetical protein
MGAGGMPQASSPDAIGVRNMPRVDGQVIQIDVGSGFPQPGQPWRASLAGFFPLRVSHVVALDGRRAGSPDAEVIVYSSTATAA